MSLLKRFVHRRQLILSGLALAILSPRAIMAQEERTVLRLSKGHVPPKPPPHDKRIVIIDPGHGAIDSGAVGTKRSEEKHVVLAIANTTVRTLLQNHPNVEMRLTRESGHFIPLYQRG